MNKSLSIDSLKDRLAATALTAKKHTKYFIQPPKKILASPKLKRSIIVACALVVLYFLVAVIPIKKVYALNTQQNWLSNLAEKIVPYPAATVGWRVILLSRLKSDINLVENFIDRSKTTDRYQDNEIKKNLYERLIEVSLVEKVAHDYDVKVAEEEIDQAWNNILVEEEGFGDVKQILKELYGVKELQIKRYIAETLLRERVEELPKKRHIRHILISFDKNNQSERDKAISKIQEAQKMVQTGTKFEDVAKEHSQDVKSRDSGGDLGWIDTAFQLEGKDELALKKAIFEMKIGEMSEPIESNVGFHLVQPFEEKGRVDKSMKQLIDEAKTQIKIIKFLKI